jgi:two-component system, OmpR family, sensor kinase
MKKPPLISLSVKVGLVLFAVVAGALAIVYVAVVPQLESRLVDAKIAEIEVSAQEIATELSGIADTDDFSTANFIGRKGEETNLTLVVLAPLTADQMLIRDESRQFQSSDTSADPIALEAMHTGLLASGRIDREGAFAEAAYPLLNNDNVLLVVTPLDDVLANVRLVRRSLLVAGAASLVISWFAGYLLAWNFTRRIRRLEAAAERLAEGDFGTPVVDRSRDEVGQLADAFDGMRLRLAMLDRARQEFIANASHELRTPLFSLGGFVELLGEEDMDPEVRRDFLAEMNGQIDRLTRLATDLLDLSRLDAGQLEVEIAAFDLAATARAVAEEFRAVAEAADQELRVEADEPVEALGDELRVQQIVRALVENAIRHTPAGTSVIVDVFDAPDGAVLEVRDDGPGIPEEDQKHLFQRFYRAAGGKASGSGLGLAIASELASRLEGSIAVVSRPGDTVFTLKLPAAGPERRPEPLVADVAS